MINPKEDVLLENLSDDDIQYILDISCRSYMYIKDVQVKTDCVELVGYDGKHVVREMSFLYNSGRVVSIQRRLT